MDSDHCWVLVVNSSSYYIRCVVNGSDVKMWHIACGMGLGEGGGGGGGKWEFSPKSSNTKSLSVLTLKKCLFTGAWK